MYGTYTGGFIAFITSLAILEQVGVPNKILGDLFVFFTLAVYAIIGVMTRTAEVSEYYVAARRVPAFDTGTAIRADWTSRPPSGMADLFGLAMMLHGCSVYRGSRGMDPDRNLTCASRAYGARTSCRSGMAETSRARSA